MLQDSIRTKEAKETKKYEDIHKNKSTCIEHLLLNVDIIVMPRQHIEYAGSKISCMTLKYFSKCTGINVEIFYPCSNILFNKNL